MCVIWTVENVSTMYVCCFVANYVGLLQNIFCHDLCCFVAIYALLRGEKVDPKIASVDEN